jgi:GT2 family glycosyltransferase
VEHPVLLIGYNRPDYIRNRLEELSQSHIVPSKVLVSLDGLTASDSFETSESDLAKASYPFEISVIRRPKNLGCSKHIVLAVSEVLSEHKTCIVIEDDVVVGRSFVGAISSAFAIMEENKNIGIAGGFSPFPRSFHPRARNSWRLSPYFSAWGWGTTSDFWKNFESFTDSPVNEQSLMNSPLWKSLSERKKQIWMKRFERGVWDFNVQYTLFQHSRFVLLPKYRVIDNVGFADLRSTHTKHVRPWSLFGEGLSEKKPEFFKTRGNCSIIWYLWSFIDSNLWAADGYFNSRARSAGIRTIFKKLLRIKKFK